MKTLMVTRLAALVGVVFDYVMLALIAMIGAMTWVGFVMWRTPDEYRTWTNLPVLVALAVIMVGLWLWNGPGRRWRPVWRGLAVIVAAGVGAVFVLCLSIWKDEFSRQGYVELVAAFTQGAAFLLVLVVLFACRRLGMRRGWWTLRSRAGLAACVVACVIYLKSDAPESPSVMRNRAALAGGVRADDASYMLTVRYWPSPGGGGHAFVAPSHELKIPREDPKRTDYLLAHRAEIMENWESLSEVRAWWAEMAAFPALEDLDQITLDRPLIKFTPVRAYMEHALAVAELRALDGEGDAALAMVADVYRVGANLEPSARTLVRGMIAVLVQKNALQSAGFVLDHAQVSARARGDFMTLLDGADRSGAVIRRLLLCESIYSEAMIQAMGRMDWNGRTLTGGERLMFAVGAGVRWLAFNPQDTINRMQEELERVSLLAEARELDAIKRRDGEMRRDLLGGFQIKNLSGRLMVPMMMPGFGSVAKSYWEKQDALQAMRGRLNGPAGAVSGSLVVSR